MNETVLNIHNQTPEIFVEPKRDKPNEYAYHMRLHNPNLDDIPAELFELKISQSENPALTGKLIFKHLSYTPYGNNWSALVPQAFVDQGMNITTDVNLIKQAMVPQLQSLLQAQGRYNFRLKWSGQFGNIKAADGLWTIFDLKQFTSTSNPKRVGNPGYFLNREVPVTIELTPAINMGNTYYKVLLKSELTGTELFTTYEKAKLFMEADNAINSAVETNMDNNQAW